MSDGTFVILLLFVQIFILATTIELIAQIVRAIFARKGGLFRAHNTN